MYTGPRYVFSLKIHKSVFDKKGLLAKGTKSSWKELQAHRSEFDEFHKNNIVIKVIIS